VEVLEVNLTTQTQRAEQVKVLTVALAEVALVTMVQVVD
jgi:hypothetical protein